MARMANPQQWQYHLWHLDSEQDWIKMAANMNFSLTPGMVHDSPIHWPQCQGRSNGVQCNGQALQWASLIANLKVWKTFLILSGLDLKPWAGTTQSYPFLWMSMTILEIHRTFSTTMERSIWDIVGSMLSPTITSKTEYHRTACSCTIASWTHCLALSYEDASPLDSVISSYTISGTPIDILLLKVVVCESYIDTNSTTSCIRDQLSSLDKFLPVIDYDIGKLLQPAHPVVTWCSQQERWDNYRPSH